MTTIQRACTELQSLNDNLRDCIQSHISTGIAFHSQLSRLITKYDQITNDLVSAHIGFRISDFGLLIKSYNGENGSRLARQIILLNTLSALENASPTLKFHRIARKNLRDWQRAISPTSRTSEQSYKIYVENEDWGTVALQKTQEFGTTFAVLNTANKSRPGAFYELGYEGQEADMYRRTDCHFSLSSAVINIDHGREYALYLPEHMDLITATNGEVYLDTDNPRICLRGPSKSSETYEIDNEWLLDKDFFLFYELRAAPYDLPTYMPKIEHEVVIRTHINAIIRTMIYKGVRHVVLGAFGCKEYANYTASVAKIFNEELNNHTEYFDVVTFAIPNKEHYDIFTREFTISEQ